MGAYRITLKAIILIDILPLLRRVLPSPIDIIQQLHFEISPLP